MPQVSVCQTESYDPARMQAAVRSHFEALDLSRQIRPDLKIVIKPNLVMKRAPEDAATTHPALVEAVIRQLQQLGAQDITIAESSGGPYAEPLLKSLYETCGMAEAARRTGAKLNLGTGSREIGGNGQVTRRFTVIDPIADADLILNLCKLKTHCMTVLSGAVKNLFGCIPGLMKPELHMRYPEKEDFCRMLLDLSAALPPVISFVDAVEAMEGDGPTGGRKKHVGLTLCSADRYALDLVNAAVLGIDPASIPTVRQSIARGLCPASLAQVQLLGDRDALTQAGPFLPPRSKQTDFSSQFPAPLRPAVKKVTRWLQPRPSIRRKDCIGCGKCAESCPAHTIQILERKAVIAYPNCIRCFCCHEMCPKQAVDIRRLGIFDL